MARTADPAREERRRAQIAATVFRLLASGSHASCTLAGVAREAGVSKGLVTYYYPSKDALILDAIARHHALQQQTMQELLARDLPARELLSALVALAFPSQELVELELRFQIEVWSFAKTRPAVWAALAVSYRSFREVCESLLGRGVREGWVRAERIPWLYRIIHALADGLSFQIALEPGLDVDALREELEGLIERLLAAP